MRILFLTSWGTACGIYTYSKNLIEKLEEIPGIEVQVYSDTTNFTGISKLAKEQGIDVVHIQHEFGISLSPEPLMSVIGKFRMSGIPVVMTMHTEDKGVCILFDGVPDAIILHNDTVGFSKKNTFSKFYQLFHGIPELFFTPTDKADLRKKYGIPEDAFVVGTCGFVSKDRAVVIEEFVTNMIPAMQEHKNIFIHLPVSAHRSDINGAFASHIRSNLEAVMEKHGLRDRFLMTAEFMSNEEFRERLHTLDLGFSYMQNKVVSNSGSAADIISAGVPVVVNDVAHFNHLKEYCGVIPEVDTVPAFVQSLVQYMNQPGGRNSDVMIELRNKASKAVQELGYSVQAKKHVEVYEKVMADMHRSSHTGTVSKNTAVTPPIPFAQLTTRLNRKLPVTVTMPNSLWQVMLLWRKLNVLTKAGISVSLNIQNEGPLDINTFKFCVDGISEVKFNDVGLLSDDRVIRIHSRSLAQNLTTDVEDWLKKDSFAHLFSFFDDSDTGIDYELNLGSYAEKTAAKIFKDPATDPIVVIACNDAEYHNMLRRLSGANTTILVAATPMYSELISSTVSFIRGIISAVNVVPFVEDFRTIMACCSKAKSVCTPWNEFAVYCLMTDVKGMLYYTEAWQGRLLELFSIEGAYRKSSYDAQRERLAILPESYQ